MSLFRRFARAIINISERRSPDFCIGPAADPYLLRWHLIPRNRVFNIYLHLIRASDDARALHDHPWLNCSILLAGSCHEITPKTSRTRVRGDIIFRRARAAHRLVLLPELDDRIPHAALGAERHSARMDAFHHRPALARMGLPLPARLDPPRPFFRPG